MKYLHAHTVSSHDVRYAYAVGRIRALETRLLGKQRLDRLAEGRDVDEVVRLLADTIYATHIEELEDHGHQVFLRNEEARLLDLVDSLSLDRETSDILRLRHDYHNLKVAVREQVSDRDLGHLCVPLGRFEFEMVRAALKTETLDALPEPLIWPAQEALEVYSKSQDLGQVDTVIDKQMFARFRTVADDYEGVFIGAIVRTWIDLADIRTFMRARYFGLETRSLPEMVIEGGALRLADFAETFALPLDEVLQRFAFSPYRQVIERGGGGLDREDSFVPLERAMDEYMASFLRLARYFTFGLEVVLAYALRKESEIRALRLIFAAKDSGLAADTIKERTGDVE